MLRFVLWRAYLEATALSMESLRSLVRDSLV